MDLWCIISRLRCSNILSFVLTYSADIWRDDLCCYLKSLIIPKETLHTFYWTRFRINRRFSAYNSQSRQITWNVCICVCWIHSSSLWIYIQRDVSSPYKSVRLADKSVIRREWPTLAPEHWRMKPAGRAWLFCIKIECRPVMDTVTTDSSDEVQ